MQTRSQADFKVKMVVAKEKSFCKLIWKEKSDRPTQLDPPGWQPNQWATYPDTTPTAVFDIWRALKKTDKCPGVPTGAQRFTDFPGTGDKKSVYRCFDVTIESSCPAGSCTHKSLNFKAVQILLFDKTGAVKKHEFYKDKTCDQPEKQPQKK
jgi:hypothetical protein